jgi:hypothetical protein
MPESIQILEVVFLPHTYPLVIGVPVLFILLTIGGAIGGYFIDKRENTHRG